MPRRLATAFGLALVTTLAALTLGACSSSQRRDQFYGTDAGAGYQPEAATFSSPDTSVVSPEVLEAQEVLLEDGLDESEQDAGSGVDS